MGKEGIKEILKISKKVNNYTSACLNVLTIAFFLMCEHLNQDCLSGSWVVVFMVSSMVSSWCWGLETPNLVHGDSGDANIDGFFLFSFLLNVVCILNFIINYEFTLFGMSAPIVYISWLVIILLLRWGVNFLFYKLIYYRISKEKEEKPLKDYLKYLDTL